MARYYNIINSQDNVSFLNEYLVILWQRKKQIINKEIITIIINNTMNYNEYIVLKIQVFEGVNTPLRKLFLVGSCHFRKIYFILTKPCANIVIAEFFFCVGTYYIGHVKIKYMYNYKTYSCSKMILNIMR